MSERYLCSDVHESISNNCPDMESSKHPSMDEL